MGKKGKAEEVESFEIWILKIDGQYYQVEERGNGGVFDNRNRALLIGQSKSEGKDVVETLVVLRRPIATFNGEAISVKHRLNLNNEKNAGSIPPPAPQVEKKEETPHAQPEVHGDRPQEGDVPAPGAQHVGEADPPRS